MISLIEGLRLRGPDADARTADRRMHSTRGGRTGPGKLTALEGEKRKRRASAAQPARPAAPGKIAGSKIPEMKRGRFMTGEGYAKKIVRGGRVSNRAWVQNGTSIRAFCAARHRAAVRGV